MALEYYDWQDGRQPGKPYTRCSPNLQAVTEEVGKRFGGWSLGCYGLRPIRGGVAWSSHSFGAAIDWRIDNATQRNAAIAWIIANHEMLGIQSIHDYVNSRIWHSDRLAWKTQPKNTTNGMGQSWAKWLHLETNPARWADGRSIWERSSTPPSTPDPAPGPDTPPGTPSMRKGATDATTVVAGWPGGRVSTLQTILGGITVDGNFGVQTDTKLRAVQLEGGLTVDGVFGPQTSAKFVEWRGH